MECLFSEVAHDSINQIKGLNGVYAGIANHTPVYC